MRFEENMDKLRKALDEANSVIAKYPNVHVYLRKKGQRHYLSVRNSKADNSEISISLSDPKAKEYVQLAYYKRLKPVLETELKCLNDVCDRYKPQAKYTVSEMFSESGLEGLDIPFKPYSLLRKEWESAEYERNTFAMDEKSSYKTEAGFTVRSKAELMISNVLYSLQLAQRNECKYVFNGQTTYPDFEVISPRDGKIYYIEYFGLMDDPEYRAKALRKIALYQSSPDASRFIFFFESESSPMNFAAIKNTLLHYFGSTL